MPEAPATGESRGRRPDASTSPTRPSSTLIQAASRRRIMEKFRLNSTLITEALDKLDTTLTPSTTTNDTPDEGEFPESPQSELVPVLRVMDTALGEMLNGVRDLRSLLRSEGIFQGDVGGPSNLGYKKRKPSMDKANNSPDLPAQLSPTHANLPSTGSLKRCMQCYVTSTPEWRRGPYGARTLCNACGLMYAKVRKMRDQMDPGSAGLKAENALTSPLKEEGGGGVQEDVESGELNGKRRRTGSPESEKEEIK
ncbi:hypothetical protein HDV05_002438 [Chytridiales sp. JEL 0842]|nr:hypothetical protein HDV05_002438 [Chytridiales sp. JEL 0842]